MTPRDVDQIMGALQELREWMSKKLEEVGVRCDARRDACRGEVFGRLLDLDMAQAEDRGYRQGKKANSPTSEGRRDSDRNMLLLLGQAWKIVVALLAAAFLAGAGSEKLAAAVLSFFGSGL